LLAEWVWISRVRPPVVGDRASGIVIDLGEDDESRVITECREWVVERGLAEGIENYELVDEETGDVLAFFDQRGRMGCSSS
jgi:hypothetical protein